MLPFSVRVLLLSAMLALTPALARADGAVPAATSDSASSGPELFDTDRPDVTDGSSRLDRGVVQVETGWSRTSDDFATSTSIGDALLRIGVTRAFELRVFTPGREHFATHGSGGASAWGEAGLGFKLGHTSANGQLGVALVGSIATPVESHGARATESQLVLAGDVGSDAASASFNLGLHTLSGEGLAIHTTLASTSVAHEFTHRLGMFLEGAAARSDEDGLEDAWSLFVDTGASWAVAHHLQLDASIGRDTAADGPWTLGAGVSKRW